MGAIFGILMRTILPIFAGLGAGAVLDKVAADKVPNYPAGGAVTPSLTGTDGKLDAKKIMWFVAITAVGTIIVRFVFKKLKIKI